MTQAVANEAGSRDGWRAGAATHLEATVDAAFAFAATLPVIPDPRMPDSIESRRVTPEKVLGHCDALRRLAGADLRDAADA